MRNENQDRYLKNLYEIIFYRTLLNLGKNKKKITTFILSLDDKITPFPVKVRKDVLRTENVNLKLHEKRVKTFYLHSVIIKLNYYSNYNNNINLN